MLTIWEITGTRQRLRYGIFQGAGEPNPLLDDFEMLNESFGELWLMVNTGKPVRKLRTLPADADVATLRQVQCSGQGAHLGGAEVARSGHPSDRRDGLHGVRQAHGAAGAGGAR